MLKLPDNVHLNGITLTQPLDSCAPIGSTESYITIITEDAGGGPYIVIDATRWSIDADEIDKFAQILKDMLKNAETSQ